ncbi:hypothetical protein [Limnohabitans sp. Rim28]|uniref:hypothetical protein n=1 Tax=Limnohabitans sp. Rim28 TaxID=1100720 RepID=UPI00031CE6DE|nr:hypothetical protein [Limnohabitans sp. Rim28]PVE06659.1 hypothetical protein B472_10170 [Limnohabitans sp. Rim28]
MMHYATLDYLPDLTFSQMATARSLTFTPHSVPSLGWDRVADVYGFNSFALLHSVNKFTAVEGATYDLFSTSYADPYLLRIYDLKGNTIMANSEIDDGAPILLPEAGGSFKQDVIYNWVAPYSGTFYVDASWDQDNFFKYYSLSIYEDKDTTASRSTNLVASLNVGNPTPCSHGLTGDNTIDAMTTGHKWVLDATRVIDFSISWGFGGEYWIDPAEVSVNLGVCQQSCPLF